MPKERLDLLLVGRGLAESREKAQRLVMAGLVRVNDQVQTSPGKRMDDAVVLVVEQPPPFVSRGGEKLAGALAAFGVQVRDRVCVDVGASTGGFTDCLLQNGAARVYALDVGRGQMHERMRKDPRVVVIEAFNARYMEPGTLPEKPSLATVDVSFISLTKILPALIQNLTVGAEVVSLVKPQFEAGRAEVGKGGVVRDPAVHRAVLDRIRSFCAAELSLEVLGECESPLVGPAGNREFFLHLRGSGDPGERGIQTALEARETA